MKPSSAVHRAAAGCYDDFSENKTKRIKIPTLSKTTPLRWPLMTLSLLHTGSPRPRRLLIVSWCNCGSALSSPCKGGKQRSLLSGCDTLAGAGNEGEPSKKLESVTESGPLRAQWKPQRDCRSVMGTKRGVSNASRKLAAVVREFARWKRGPCLRRRQVMVLTGQPRGSAGGWWLFRPRP